MAQLHNTKRMMNSHAKYKFNPKINVANLANQFAQGGLHQPESTVRGCPNTFKKVVFRLSRYAKSTVTLHAFNEAVFRGKHAVSITQQLHKPLKSYVLFPNRITELLELACINGTLTESGNKNKIHPVSNSVVYT